MNNEKNINNMLEEIQLSEGEGFVFNENAIEQEYQKKDADNSSLAIKILTIFGGLLAALAFISFLIISRIYESETFLLILGTMLISGSIFLNKISNKIITDTLSLTALILGYVMIGYSLDKFGIDWNLIRLLYVVIAFLTLCITQNYLLSFISILIINGTLLSFIIKNKSFDLIHIYIAIITFSLTFCFLYEAKLISKSKVISKLYNPVRIGLLISMIVGLIFVGKEGMLELSAKYIWISSVFIIPILIYVTSLILKIININDNKYKMIIYAASILILLPTALSPAISGSLLILLLSFLVNYKTGFAISCIAFIYFVSQYYYDLNFTLLTKSELMFASGILFLLFYFFTYKKLGTNEKV